VHDRANVNAPTSGQSGGRSASQMAVWQTTLLFDNGHLEELAAVPLHCGSCP
jgi:hypothetical protein